MALSRAQFIWIVPSLALDSGFPAGMTVNYTCVDTLKWLGELLSG